MDDIKKTLENWLSELNSFSLESYEALPDMNLYMEQVVQLLRKQLHIFETTSLDKIITPSMINNYVKGEVIPSPIGKKYNREHIALIEEVCTLKQVLSINEVKQIEDMRYKDVTVKGEIFNDFNALNKEKLELAVNDAIKGLNNYDGDDKSLIDLALELSLTANAYIVIAKRILFLERIKKEIEENKKALENKEA